MVSSVPSRGRAGNTRAQGTPSNQRASYNTRRLVSDSLGWISERGWGGAPDRPTYGGFVVEPADRRPNGRMGYVARRDDGNPDSPVLYSHLDPPYVRNWVELHAR